MKKINKNMYIIIFVIIASCSNNEVVNNTEQLNTNNFLTIIPEIDTSTKKEALDSKQVEYTIIRNPNDSGGVFDFMYIVYVSKKINHAETQWIFDDIINKKGGRKIAIDVWDSKKAFYAELNVYNRELNPNNSRTDFKEIARQERIISKKYDVHNIAKYTNNGIHISTSFPDGK